MRNLPKHKTYKSCDICGKVYDKARYLMPRVCSDCSYIPPHIPPAQREKVQELRRKKHEQE